MLAKSKPEAETEHEAPAGSTLGDHPEIAGIAEGMDFAIALLQVHFGTDHKVIRSYADTWAVCANAKVKIAASSRIIKRRVDGAMLGDAVTKEDIQSMASAEIEQDAKVLLEALDARDVWMKEARREALKS